MGKTILNNKTILSFKEEGNLGMLGYNVSSKKNMSDKQRQMLLKEIIDHKRMSVVEVRSALMQYISLNKNRYDQKNAVLKWQKDLAYVDTLFDDGSVQMTLFDL